jgi:cell division protein FtsB
MTPDNAYEIAGIIFNLNSLQRGIIARNQIARIIFSQVRKIEQETEKDFASIKRENSALRTRVEELEDKVREQRLESIEEYPE